MADLKDTLLKLDVSNDNHWTADGQARIDTVRILAGDPSITREMVDAAAPGFNKATAVGYALAGAAVTAPVAGSAPATAAEPQGGEPNAAPLANGAQNAPQAETPQPDESGGGDDESRQAEQSEVEDFGPDAVRDEVETLEAELEEIQSAMSDRRRQIDALKQEVDAMAIREADLHAAIEAKTDRRSDNVGAIQAYLASQRKILEQRGARKTMIRESGLDLKALAAGLRAPIDSAMARKTGRGGKRPTRV